MDRPEDYHLGKIAEELSSKGLKMISVVYGMDIKQHELDNIDAESGDDQQKVMREILRKWRNRTSGTKTQLANYLYSSDLIKDDIIRKNLELEENFSFERIVLKAQTTGTQLEQSALGRLAKEIDQSVMLKVINNELKISMAIMENIKADNRGDIWSAIFEALVKWSNNAKNTRQELRKHLKAGEVDTKQIQDILGSDDETDPGIQVGHFKKQKREETLKPSHDPKIGPDTTDDAPVYDMDPEHPGYVLIFNNKQFPHGKVRHGTDEDAQRLTDEFSQRGFLVVEEKDLSVKDMATKIKAFVMKDRLKSSEDLEEFLKNIKLEEQEKQRKEEYLAKLEEDAVVGGWDTFREKRILIEMTRKEIGEFRLGEDDIKKIDDPKTKAEMEEFKKATKIGAKEKKNMEDFLKKMEDEELENASSSVVVFMSHGGNGYIKDKDGGKADIDNLINEFTSDNCKALAGKPKAFLIQACRGVRQDVQTDDEAVIEPEVDYPIKDGQAIPKCADMIIGYATSAGQVAFRYPKSDHYPEIGAVFIEELCDVLNKCGNNMDVLAMTTKINNQVAERFHGSKNPAKQMSEFRHSLRKRWLLPKKQTE